MNETERKNKERTEENNDEKSLESWKKIIQYLSYFWPDNSKIKVLFSSSISFLGFVEFGLAIHTLPGITAQFK